MLWMLFCAMLVMTAVWQRYDAASYLSLAAILLCIASAYWTDIRPAIKQDESESKE